jgi:exodeoxyribonuclease VII large subunit
VVSRRFPNLHILLAPAKVQGQGAAEEIAAAIDRLNQIGGLDVLIVGRGGGSLEDLWCFNEEVVARAIARSEIPIISAVGHEIDFTISDFVADLRAPTPSAAAELVVGRKDTFEERLQQYESRLTRTLRERLLAERARLERAASSYVFREPANAVARHREKLDMAALRIRHRLQDAVRESQQTLDWLSERAARALQNTLEHEKQRLDRTRGNLAHNMQMHVQRSVQDIRRYETQLRALNPLAVLQRGYSVTRTADGQIISNVEQIKPGDIITTTLSDGSVESRIEKITAKEIKE